MGEVGEGGRGGGRGGENEGAKKRSGGGERGSRGVWEMGEGGKGVGRGSRGGWGRKEKVKGGGLDGGREGGGEKRREGWGERGLGVYRPSSPALGKKKKWGDYPYFPKEKRGGQRKEITDNRGNGGLLWRAPET